MHRPMSRKPLFDFLRRLLGRGFRQNEVDALDDLLDHTPDESDARFGFDQVPRRIGAEGIALIKRFEGCARIRPDGLIAAYPDPGTGGAPWTIGWGATGGGIDHGTVWTQAQCDRRLANDLARYAAEVSDAIGDAPCTQAQFDALVSFHYNTGAIARATLTRCHTAGNTAGAAAEFGRWRHAGGRVMAGLVRRRAAEARLYASS